VLTSITALIIYKVYLQQFQLEQAKSRDKYEIRKLAWETREKELESAIIILIA